MQPTCCTPVTFLCGGGDSRQQALADASGEEAAWVTNPDLDQEALLPKGQQEEESCAGSCCWCCAMCCGCCGVTAVLLFLSAALMAAVAPVVPPTLKVFNASSAEDIVANMPFPRTGPLPGIWWMDQYGNHLDAVPDDYPYYFPYAAPEILFTIHGSRLIPSTEQPDQSCFYPVGGGGISENATWTYVNQNGAGVNYFWPLLNPPTPDANYTGMAFCMSNDSFISFTNTSETKQTMRKTVWGWSRRNEYPSSKADPGAARTRASILGAVWPAVWGIPDVDYSRTQHYPVFQVIDADGKPTEHFKAFQKFINKEVPCKTGWLTWLERLSPWLRPYLLGKENYCNEGPGTLLYSPLMESPPGPPCNPFCDVNATSAD